MSNLSFIISIAALLTSLLIPNCKESISLNETLTSIIAICTTLIVGVHFLDSWTVNRMSEKVNKLAVLEEELKQTREQANIALHLTTAIGFISWKPQQAIEECWKAFEMSMAQNDAIRANTCLDCMEHFKQRIQDTTDTKIRAGKFSNIIIISNKTLSSPLYKVFRKRINEIIE